MVYTADPVQANENIDKTQRTLPSIFSPINVIHGGRTLERLPGRVVVFVCLADQFTRDSPRLGRHSRSDGDRGASARINDTQRITPENSWDET